MTDKPAWLNLLPVPAHYPEELFHHIKGHADRGDYGHAAYIEREMFVDVLKSIAIGVDDPKMLAIKALKTLELGFSRDFT